MKTGVAFLPTAAPGSHSNSPCVVRRCPLLSRSHSQRRRPPLCPSQCTPTTISGHPRFFAPFILLFPPSVTRSPIRSCVPTNSGTQSDQSLNRDDINDSTNPPVPRKINPDLEDELPSTETMETSSIPANHPSARDANGSAPKRNKKAVNPASTMSTGKRNPFTSIASAVFSTIKQWFAPPAFIVGAFTGILLSAALLFIPAIVSSSDALLREKVTLFDVILHDINDSYVEKVDINRLFETGINSMLGTLDPYTQFENNTQTLEMTVKTNGRYAGVGLGLALGDQDIAGDRPIIVVSAFEGYAFDAGLRPGDVIRTVSAVDVKGLSLEKVTEMLRGDPGTSVEVTVLRQGFDSPLPFTLNRRSVQIKDVPAETLLPGNSPSELPVAYVRLQSFAKDAASEVAAAITRLTPQERSLGGVVLDLRGNPGGLLNAAIEVAELIVPNGATIVSTKGRTLGPAPVYKSTREPMIRPGTPLAILVNGQTASASEIVAGAVQDLDLGVIVGSRTFGKGLVQNVQELPFNTALKYTVGKYYTPSGRCIQALNYTQGEKESSIFETKQIEESQRKEFRTARGRVVRDGGGIEPDIEVQKRPSSLEYALQRQNMYFHFATQFGAQSKMDKLPADFAVTDAIYKDFVRFVSDSGLKYESEFDDALNKLDKMFEEVGYNTARGKVSDLKKATNDEMWSDFVRHEAGIRVLVESAIRYRFQPDSERIIADLKNDDQLAEAIRAIRNGKEYECLLSQADSTIVAQSR